MEYEIYVKENVRNCDHQFAIIISESSFCDYAEKRESNKREVNDLLLNF